ncbi:hypothetical protein BD289DRAFT_372661, partial [Coniella lustricola]
PATMAEGDDYDTTYATQGAEAVPVQKDGAAIESGVNAATADSDEQLERDEKDAIDKSNIVEERTRGAKPGGTYREPGDEEGLPAPE